MANINVVVDKPIADGYKLKFRTPCDSTTIEGLEVKYPAKNGVGTLIKKFVFKDAHGTELSGFGNLFVSGVMIEVLLDVTHSVAYIQNADTNSYVESVKSDIQRLEESQKQFLTVAGVAVERCENIADSADGFEKAMNDATERAESVQGLYVGSGDMPEGYSVQIDPNGDVFVMDAELDLMSQNPVTNQAITYNFGIVNNTIADVQKEVDSNKDKISVIETANIGRDNKIESLENQTSNLFDSVVSVDGRVTEIEIKQTEQNKVLWEGSATVGEGTNSSVAIAAIGIENYSVISVDGRIYTKDEASNSFNSITFERALYDGENETIALDIRKIWYGQSMAVIRNDAEVNGRDRVCSHTRLFWLLDVDLLDSGTTMFEYPSSFSVSKIIGIM